MSDCLIVGGGIIGLLTAHELSSAGADVQLLERGRTGLESSWAGGGIISPLYPWRYPPAVTALASWSQRRYPSLADTLQAATGIDPEFVRSGLLVLDSGESRIASEWARRTGNSLQILDREATRACEPALKAAPDSALWMPAVAQVRNPRLVQCAREALKGRVDIREESEVKELLIENSRIVGVRTANGPRYAQNTIICAGAWTADLFKSLGKAPAIQPVRGQMLLFRARPGLISRIVLSAGRYAIPRRDGRVLVGSTLEHRGFEKATTQEAHDELYRTAGSLFPELIDFPVDKHWAGLRPGSPAGIPYIGRYPDIDGLYFNSGHFRNGVVLAPASARLLADILLGKDPILDPAPYTLEAERFA